MPDNLIWTSLVAQMVKRLSTMRETWVRSLGWEDLPEKEMAIHSSTIAWKIPWTEEPGRLQSMGSQRVGHDWAISLHFNLLLGTSRVVLVVKTLPANAGDARDTSSIPGSGRSLEQEMVTHSSIRAWKIPWTEEPGRLQSMGPQRVRHNWVTEHTTHT